MPDHVLQPGRHHLGRLPGEVPSWYPVRSLGNVGLFGQERGDALESILDQIEQSAFGQPAIRPSVLMTSAWC
jgi:hypothetical protein